MKINMSFNVTDDNFFAANQFTKERESTIETISDTTTHVHTENWNYNGISEYNFDKVTTIVGTTKTENYKSYFPDKAAHYFERTVWEGDELVSREINDYDDPHDERNGEPRHIVGHIKENPETPDMKTYIETEDGKVMLYKHTLTCEDPHTVTITGYNVDAEYDRKIPWSETSVLDEKGNIVSRTYSDEDEVTSHVWGYDANGHMTHHESETLMQSFENSLCRNKHTEDIKYDGDFMTSRTLVTQGDNHTMSTSESRYKYDDGVVSTQIYDQGNGNRFMTQSYYESDNYDGYIPTPLTTTQITLNYDDVNVPATVSATAVVEDGDTTYKIHFYRYMSKEEIKVKNITDLKAQLEAEDWTLEHVTTIERITKVSDTMTTESSWRMHPDARIRNFLDRCFENNNSKTEGE